MTFTKFSLLRSGIALAVLVGAVAALPSTAQEIGYYAGVYEVVGRDASKHPKLINSLVRLEPEGEALRAQSCQAADGLLEFQSGEAGNFLIGQIAGLALFCSIYNNPDNYAHLACRGENGELLTLWPTMEPSDTELFCG